MQRQANLTQVVHAVRPAGGFASGLHRGQEQRHEYTNDGNDDQQFDEGEGAAGHRSRAGCARREWLVVSGTHCEILTAEYCVLSTEYLVLSTRAKGARGATNKRASDGKAKRPARRVDQDEARPVKRKKRAGRGPDALTRKEGRRPIPAWQPTAQRGRSLRPQRPARPARPAD